MNATLPVLNGNRNARFVIPGINLDAFNFTIRSVNRAAKLCQPHGHFTTFSLLEILVEPFRRDELLMSQSSIKGLSDMSGVQEPRPDERPKQIAESVRGPYRRRRARTLFWYHQLSEVIDGDASQHRLMPRVRHRPRRGRRGGSTSRARAATHLDDSHRKKRDFKEHAPVYASSKVVT
jgi:hypothetical protein